MKIENLKQLGIPTELISQFQANGFDQLTSTQIAAIEAGLLNGTSLLISAPTSSGKTTIAELAAISAAEKGRKTVYLVTHKALAEEKYAYFKTTYEADHNPWFNVSITTGDRSDGTWNSGVCIATYEKFLSLMATQPIHVFENLVVVADEIQTVGDTTRGADIELLCTIMLHATPYQFIGLSATMPNAQELANWLGCQPCEVQKRDVPLRQEIWNAGKVTYAYSDDGEVFVDNDQEIPNRIDSFRVAEDLVRRGEHPVLVFCMTRARAEELANRRTGEAVGRAGLSEIGRQLELFCEPTSLGDKLRGAAEARTAFHTADLGFSERAVVEQGIRDGMIDVVFATPTLAAGVNLPIRAVVFDSFSRPWADQPYISQSEYTNMAGRAGRLGYHEQGNSILIPMNRIEYRLATQYISSKPERVQSALFNSSIRKPVLQLIASGICGSRDSLISFLKKSLWFVQTEDANLELANRLSDRIDEAIEWFVVHELCVLSDRGVHATELGRSVSATGLLPSTAIEILSLTKHLNPSDIKPREFALIHLACASDEFRSDVGKRFLPFARRNRAEPDAYTGVRNAGAFVNPDSVNNQDRVDNASYALSLWSQGVDEKGLGRAVPAIRYGQIQGLAQDVSWIFDGIRTVLSCPAVGADAQLLTEFELLGKRIRYGVTTDGIDVMEAVNYSAVPGLGRHRTMKLVENKVAHPSKLLELKTDELSKFVESNERAEALLNAVANMFKKPIEYWRNRQLERASEVGADVSLIESLYDNDGVEYETHVLTLFKRMGLDAELFDDGKRQGAPDIVIRNNGDNVFVECKSRENRKRAPISTEDAFAILTKANDLEPSHCITIAKPGVGSHAKRKTTSNGALTIIEHRILIQAYLAYFEGIVSKGRLITWLTQPGIAQGLGEH